MATERQIKANRANALKMHRTESSGRQTNLLQERGPSRPRLRNHRSERRIHAPLQQPRRGSHPPISTAQCRRNVPDSGHERGPLASAAQVGNSNRRASSSRARIGPGSVVRPGFTEMAKTREKSGAAGSGAVLAAVTFQARTGPARPSKARDFASIPPSQDSVVRASREAGPATPASSPSSIVFEVSDGRQYNQALAKPVVRSSNSTRHRNLGWRFSNRNQS